MTTTAARHPLAAFWEQRAFSIGEAHFLWLDVALAAMAHGDWSGFERRLTEGLACASRAAAERVASPEAAIDEAATAFRYARDLISGSDMSAWLARVALSTDDWMAYITRDVLRQLWSHEIEMILDRYAPSPRHLEAAAIAEGICSGLFDAFDASFSERAAIAFDACPDVFAIAASHAHTEPATRLVRQHVHWLTMRPEAECIARAMQILSIEDAYRAAADRLIREESLLAAIETRRLDWVAVDADTIAFVDEDAAREAILCAREDRLSMQDIAAMSRHAVAREHRFLEDVPAEHRDRWLSAEPGCVIGPLRVDGRFEVAVVLARTTPMLQDERVAERARAVVLDQAGQRAAREHVKRPSN